MRLRELFGKRARERRESREISLRGMGRRLGVRHSYVAQIEKGEHAPTLDTVERVAEALGVPPHSLLR